MTMRVGMGYFVHPANQHSSTSAQLDCGTGRKHQGGHAFIVDPIGQQLQLQQQQQLQLTGSYLCIHLADAYRAAKCVPAAYAHSELLHSSSATATATVQSQHKPMHSSPRRPSPPLARD